PGRPASAVLAPEVAGDAIKPGLERAPSIKSIQRLPQSHESVVREIRCVLGGVRQPEKPPIQTVVMLGHKLFALVLLFLQLQWLADFNHSSCCASIRVLLFTQVSLELSCADGLEFAAPNCLAPNQDARDV